MVACRICHGLTLYNVHGCLLHTPWANSIRGCLQHMPRANIVRGYLLHIPRTDVVCLLHIYHRLASSFAAYITGCRLRPSTSAACIFFPPELPSCTRVVAERTLMNPLTSHKWLSRSRGDGIFYTASFAAGARGKKERVKNKPRSKSQREGGNKKVAKMRFFFSHPPSSSLLSCLFQPYIQGTVYSRVTFHGGPQLTFDLERL